MSTVRLIGCLHLQHEGIAKHRGFETSKAHDEYLIKQWNSVVGKKDLTYILGDITMETSKHYHLLNELKGRKKVVLGNHDLIKDVPALLQYVEGVAGAIKYKGYMLTHIPIHPNEVLSYRGNIHAHIHQNELAEVITLKNYQQSTIDTVQSALDTDYFPSKNKYFCVDAFKLDFIPQTIEQLIK